MSKPTSILELLFRGEVKGYSEDTTPEHAEADFYFDAFMKELEKWENRPANIYDFLASCANSSEKAGFKRGVRFAIAFMAEAMQPPMKTFRDFKDDLKTIT
jgi:hypothetical protein